MSKREKILLPPKYYLDYFRYLMKFIEQGSGHLLDEDDLQFIAAFDALDEDAQCLFVRMMNRKGIYFRMNKLTYEEIHDIGVAADELIAKNMASLDPPNDPQLFSLFTKAELHKLFPEEGFLHKYKEEVLAELVETTDVERYDILRANHSIVHFLVQPQVEFIKFLFFGHTHGMMTEFVIRDVGNVKLENLENHSFTPWFETREEALAVFELHEWRRALKAATEMLLPVELLTLVESIDWAALIQFPRARKIGDKLMLQLGEYFEKSDLPQSALSFYALAAKPPARERRVRILEKMGDMDQAKSLAKEMSNDSRNAQEQLFSLDFLAKKKKRNYRSTTAKIKSSPEIVLPRTHFKVEQEALSYFQELGFNGVHAENYLWRGLFGLLFWEELFGVEHAVFHHPLQRLPSDLHQESFWVDRKAVLIQKTNGFKRKKQLLQFLEQTHASKESISNPLVSWHESLWPSIVACIERLPLKGILNVMLEMGKNVKDNSTGFPDLFIWKEQEYYFYEIKSPNDHLSSQQLFWIDFLQSQKIRAEVLRVRYEPGKDNE